MIGRKQQKIDLFGKTWKRPSSSSGLIMVDNDDDAYRKPFIQY
jgi:hypothetical protein